jgi:enoyl-CoA hydratase
MALDRYEAFERITFERDDRVLIVTLNRPDAMNAVDQQLHRELARVFEDIAFDPETDAVVLTGAGDAFCAGGDLDWIAALPAGRASEWMVVEGRKIVRDLLTPPQPIIAAVNGAAVGLGATVALFCDVIFAASSARISDPHVKVGLVAGDGGAAIWPLLLGPARAKQYLLTGDWLSAAQAKELGLINEAVADDALRAEALAFARRLTEGSQPAIRATKKAVNHYLMSVVEPVVDLSLALEHSTFGSADVLEGTTAMRERRAPKFSD